MTGSRASTVTVTLPHIQQMSKRRVPHPLHSELSEYASLLRALRTRNTLNLTPHLTKPSNRSWSRWPLLLHHIPIPEWSLEDEVAVIASTVIKSQDDDDPDHPSYIPYLTSSIASLLSTIFSLLAKHTPARPASMQNRIEPLNWRSVIDVIVTCDISEYSNPKYVLSPDLSSVVIHHCPG